MIGRTFDQALPQRVSGLEPAALEEELHRLERAGFLREAAVYPERELTFHHPQLQESALRAQLTDRREQLHRAAAAALEALRAHALDENAALIAQHWDEGGDPLAAMRWYSRAAAWDSQDPASVVQCAQQVWTLREQAGPSAEVAKLAVGACCRLLGNCDRLGLSSDQAGDLFQQALELAEDDVGLLTSLHIARADAHRCFGEHTMQAESSKRAIELADRSGDLALRMQARLGYGLVLWDFGVFREGLKNAESILALGNSGPGLLSQPGPVRRLSAFAHLFRATALDHLGRFAEAGALYGELFKAARQSGSVPFLSVVLVCYNVLEYHRGDAERCLQLMEEARALDLQWEGIARPSRRTGSAWQTRLPGAGTRRRVGGVSAVTRGQSNQRVLELRQSRSCLPPGRAAEKARQAAKRGLEIARSRGMRGWESRALQALADAQLAIDGARAASRVRALLPGARDRARARVPLHGGADAGELRRARSCVRRRGGPASAPPAREGPLGDGRRPDPR